MRSFVAIVFENQPNAFEGLRELERLDAGGTITLHDVLVIERGADGAIAPKFSRTREPPLRGPGIGALLGVLAGLAAGPVGVALGGAVGVLGGALEDAVRSEASDEFIALIGTHVTPGSFAVIADVHENEHAAINSSMLPLAGRISREPRPAVLGDLVDKRGEGRRATKGAPTQGR